MKTIDLGSAAKALAKNKYVLLVLCLGLLLMLLPGKRSGSDPEGAGSPLDSSGIPVDTESLRLAELLEQIRGVGNASVLLSGSGAVVVCTGADSPEVRLGVTQAVAAYTGLGSDKITILKME